MIYYIQLVIYVIAIIQGFRGAHGGFNDDQIDLNRTPRWRGFQQKGWNDMTTSRLFIGALYWDGIECGAEPDRIEEHLPNTPRFLLSKYG